jgi:hypothetical protein
VQSASTGFCESLLGFEVRCFPLQLVPTIIIRLAVGESTGQLRLPHKLWQFRDVGRDPPRFVAGERIVVAVLKLVCRASLIVRLILSIPSMNAARLLRQQRPNKFSKKEAEPCLP